MFASGFDCLYCSYSALFLSIKLKNCNMWGGGQRSFGTFSKIHLFWRRHPSLINRCKLYIYIYTNVAPLAPYQHEYIVYYTKVAHLAIYNCLVFVSVTVHVFSFVSVSVCEIVFFLLSFCFCISCLYLFVPVLVFFGICLCFCFVFVTSHFVVVFNGACRVRGRERVLRSCRSANIHPALRHHWNFLSF